MSRIQARSEWQSIIALKVTAPQDMFALARLDVRRVMTETAQNEPRAAPTFTIFALIHRPYDVLGGRKLMLPNDSLTIEERDAQPIVGSGGSDLKEDVCCPRWQTIRRWPGEPRSAASNVFRPPGFAALGQTRPAGRCGARGPGRLCGDGRVCRASRHLPPSGRPRAEAPVSLSVRKSRQRRVHRTTPLTMTSARVEPAQPCSTAAPRTW